MTTHLLELLEITLRNAAELKNETTSGGRLAGVDVTTHNCKQQIPKKKKKKKKKRLIFFFFVNTSAGSLQKTQTSQHKSYRY
jgi:hypothetical protein